MILVALSRVTFLALGPERERGLRALGDGVHGRRHGGRVPAASSRAEPADREGQLSRERADAEMRYRILADNAVDVIIHLRGTHVAWVSPSVEAALGGPTQQWIGSDFSVYIHPDDLGTLEVALQRILHGESVTVPGARPRRSHHWVDGHGNPMWTPAARPTG